MKDFETKRINLFNRTLADRCDMFGIRNTICWLMDEGFTKDEIIINLGFDEDDVNYVIENPDEDYVLC